MSSNLHNATLLFLDCLFDATLDAAGALINPSAARFASGGWDDEPLERKLRRMAARGVITLPDPADPRVVRLTEEGRRLAGRRFDPEQRWNRRWDGQWRMVLFDVGEHERAVRERFRRVLHQARLGYLQGSVWVSPDPLDDLRATVRSLAPNPEALLFFAGRPIAGETDADLVAGAWDFRRINTGYEQHQRFLNHTPPADAEPQRWRQWLGRERLAWVEAVQPDPFLPAQLLPAGYAGREIHRRRRIIRQRAAAFAFGFTPAPLPADAPTA